jgi:uncharacterized protein (TIGR00369 family)
VTAAAPGFSPLPLRSPFLDGRIELWVDESHPRRFGIRVQPQHCNGRGLAHGGFLSTLVDVAAGYTLAPLLPASAALVTTSLRAEFVGAARAGDWLESRVDRLRPGRRLGVVAGAWVRAGEEIVVFSASFLRMDAGAGEAT